jgi:hypothetical protein
MKKHIWTKVNELGDFAGTIEELQEILNKLAEQYGKEAQIKVDAGYNNVDFLVKQNDKS